MHEAHLLLSIHHLPPQHSDTVTPAHPPPQTHRVQRWVPRRRQGSAPPGWHLDPHTHIRTWSHAHTLPSPSTHTHTHPLTHKHPPPLTHTLKRTFSGGGSPGGGEGAPHLNEVVAGDALHPQAAGQQGVQHGGHVAVHVMQAQVLLQQLRGDHLTHQRVLYHHRLRRQLPLDGACNAVGPRRETIKRNNLLQTPPDQKYASFYQVQNAWVFTARHLSMSPKHLGTGSRLRPAPNGHCTKHLMCSFCPPTDIQW